MAGEALFHKIGAFQLKGLYRCNQFGSLSLISDHLPGSLLGLALFYEEISGELGDPS
jgi:hypothetical protein